jgi:acetate kinase
MSKIPVHILIFNCGSSSLTYKVFRVRSRADIETVAYGKAHRVGVKGTGASFIEHHYDGKSEKDVISIPNHQSAARLILRYVEDSRIKVDCIGHRFVHGGSHFKESALLDAGNLKKLLLCLPLAPIHNPVSLAVIYEARKFFPKIRQFVTFDSAFHSSIPDYAYTYALPARIIKKFGFRKYGFHGLSYSYVAGKVPELLGRRVRSTRIVACHLGTGGSSVAAIDGGRSVDSSMGYSPLTGLIMSTRCGDIDPMLMIYLMSAYGYRPDELMDVLNKKSGLLGISGFSSDITDIIHHIYEKKDMERASLAFNMYIHRLRKYVGSYIAALGGIDALVFTDDIGVHNWQVRERVCADMEWAGISLERSLNRKVSGDEPALVNAKRSRVKIVLVPTEEEFIICLEGAKLLGY